MRLLPRLSRSWPLSWLLVIPLVTLLGIWGYRTVDMYRELGLRNLADERLSGMTLHKAGVLQFRYLVQSIRLEIIRALATEDEGLPRVHLFIEEADLTKLDSERPRSGKEYVQARLYNDGKFSRVKARYRGDFAWHWGFFKRSFRVRTKRSDLFMGIRKFNLITPKTSFLYSNHMGYEMAHLIGLLAPRSEMVNLNINGRHRGIHLLVEQIGETTLRDAGRLPGDIYSGDELYGIDIWHGVGLPLFESAGLWQKVAYNNHYPEGHNYPLRQLLLALKLRDQARLADLLDLEAFAVLNLWEQLAIASHLDDEHNWRLYFDPGRARFYPILWDGMPWGDSWLADDWKETWKPSDRIIASTLMRTLHQNPDFLDIKRRVFRSFLTSEKPELLIESIKAINAKLENSVATDTATLDENLEWITPEDAVRRMEDNVELVTQTLAKLEQLYPPGDVATQKPGPSPLIWRGDIHLDRDTTIEQPLVIEAGTRVTLDENVSLFIRDRLSIEGTTDNPVVVSPAGNAVFGAVVLEGRAADGSRINGLKMYGGSGYRDDLREYSGMLSIHDVRNVRLTNTDLSDNHDYDDQLHVVYSDIAIDHCSFTNAPMDAIDLDMSDAVISNSVFMGNGNDGLDLMGARVTTRNSLFAQNGDKGISVGERSILEITDSSFSVNNFGIQVKDDSFVSANDLTFARNKTAIDAYAKNWRYEQGGYGVFCASEFTDNDQLVTTDRKSKLDIHADQCPALDAGTIDSLKSELSQRG